MKCMIWVGVACLGMATLCEAGSKQPTARPDPVAAEAKHNVGGLRPLAVSTGGKVNHGIAPAAYVAKETFPFKHSSMLVRSVDGRKNLFVWIGPASFQMGSTESDVPDRNVDEVRHRVDLAKGFWILDHEVTQKEYRLVMGENPPARVDEDLPVANVTWDEANAFCRLLTSTDRAKGLIHSQLEYRLPTEAEWEYVAQQPPSNPLDRVAWYSDNAGGRSRTVLSKQANVLGIHDMLGNVWEWCSDWYGDYETGRFGNPTGPKDGTLRVVRGGSWSTPDRQVRPTYRNKAEPGSRFEDLGFRPVLSRVGL